MVVGAPERWCPNCHNDLEAPGEEFDPDRIFAVWASRRSIVQGAATLAFLAALAGLGLAFTGVKLALDRGHTLAAAVTPEEAPLAMVGIAIAIASPVVWAVTWAVVFRCPACGRWPNRRERSRSSLHSFDAHRGDPDDGAPPSDPAYCAHCKVRLR